MNTENKTVQLSADDIDPATGLPKDASAPEVEHKQAGRFTLDQPEGTPESHPEDAIHISDEDLDPKTGLPSGATLASPTDQISSTPTEEPGLLDTAKQLYASVEAMPLTSAAGALDDAITGGKKGAVSTVAPFSDRANNETPTGSKVELGAEIVSSLVVDLGLTSSAAQAGAVMGTMIAPGIGTVAGGLLGAAIYSAYSGIGTEYQSAKINNREFSPARATAQVALNLNPAVRIEGAMVKALRDAEKAGSKVASATLKAGMLSEKAAVRAARVAGQVAGSAGLAATENDGSTQGAVLSGVVNAAFMYPVFKNATVAVSPQMAKAQGDFLNGPIGYDLKDRISQRVAKEIPADFKVEKQQLYNPEFMDYLLSTPGKGESAASLSELSSAKKRAKVDKLIAVSDGAPTDLQGGFSESKLNEYYQGFLANKIAKEEMQVTYQTLTKMYNVEAANGIHKTGKKLTDDPVSDTGFGFALDSIKRSGQIARQVDEKTGYGFSRIIDKYSERLSQFQGQAAVLKRSGIEAIRAQTKAGLSNEDMARVRIAISEKDYSILTPELRAVIGVDGKILNKKIDNAVRQWDRAWEQAADVLNTNGYELGNIQRYVPMRSLPQDLLATQIRRSINTLGGMANAVGVADFTKLTRDDFAKLPAKWTDRQKDAAIEELQHINGVLTRGLKKPLEEITQEDAGNMINSLLNRKGTKGFGFEMSALYSRGDAKIPERFRDLDIGRAFDRYVNLNVRGSYMDDLNRQMRDGITVLEAGGLKSSASYFQNWLEDEVGEGAQKGATGWILDQQKAYRHRVDKYFDADDFRESATGKALYNVSTVVPDLMSKVQANMYPSLLGLNLRGSIENAQQALKVTAPEMGGVYGYGKVSAAMVRATEEIFNPSTGKLTFSKMKDLLAKRGLSSESPLMELAEGSSSSGPIKAMNDFFMKIYSFSDEWNRLVSYHAGHSWAEDIVGGDTRAIESLKNMSPAVRNQLKGTGFSKALEAGDSEAMGDILGRYLISKTQFHYGKEQKSAAQKMLGPLSQFTTWPSEMAGNVMEILRNDTRFTKGFQYFVQPLFVAYAIREAADMDEKNPGLMKYLLKDPVETTAINTAFQAKDIGLNGYWPTTIQSALGFGQKQATDPDADNLESGAKRAVKTQLKTVAAPISSVLNELDRFQKDYKGESKGVTDDIVDKLMKD